MGDKRRGAAGTPALRTVTRLGALGSLAALVALVGLVAPAPLAGSAADAISSTPYTCTFNVSTDAITGAYGTASAIGWAGNAQGVTTCLGGAFYVQDGINQAFGFGIYSGSPTTWVDAEGYLPAQITTFGYRGATVAITEFADQVVLGGNPYVAVYSRVEVTNSTNHAVTADPEPSPGLIPLATGPTSVRPHTSVAHDYVLAVDRFGNAYPWPSAQSLLGAGGFNQHFAHMRAFWNGQLAHIAGVHVPDARLDDAYRSGFISTQIARSGNDLNTGVNGYGAEFSHDVIGILANLFTQGDYENAQALLLEAQHVVGAQGQYEDGIWTYSWPWAIYLMKTGDLTFVKANFSTPGPAGATQPSIEQTAHAIAADRTGPDGIMGVTNDIDSDGYWTVDDYEALMGLAAYRYLAQQVGDTGEEQWATSQYDSLLTSTNQVLSATITHDHLTYIPCSMVQPNTANRCKNPQDANWAAPMLFGRWAWDAPLFGAPVSGPGITSINATYAYGFNRLKGLLPADTFGGYPSDYFYSTAYNAGYGSWGLASSAYRDQGIVGYEFMITNSQSGPYSWWESASAPSSTSPWVGRHPASGQGSSPHAWGMANANKVLLDSLLAQESNGDLMVGRGVPDGWVSAGGTMSVSNFPTTDGHRLGATISPQNGSVTLTLRGSAPTGAVLFELPAFVNNIAATSSGSIDQKTGTVQVASGVRRVTVRLRHSPS